MDRIEQPFYKIPIDGRWATINNKWLKELETSNRSDYLWFDFYISEFQKNPISFFLPHGPAHPLHGNMGRAILNDYEHDLLLCTAPNQVGKTTIAAAYIILRSIPCNPSWPLFKEHGVTCPEWTGPKKIIAGTYSWELMNGLWGAYKGLLPRSELLQYSNNWGSFKGETGRQRPKSFRHSGGEVVLACGTEIIFKCYRQSVSQWESIQADMVHCDEQIPEDHYDGASARQSTRGDFTPIIMALTGHVIKDRPDTGAAGWIKRKIVDAGETKGRNVGMYNLDIPTCPKIFMSNKKKEKLRVQWVVEPEKNRDFEKIEEGKARYGGGWQAGAGLTFDQFNEDVHIIQPFDHKKYKPTYYRMIDHGTKPCACLMFAVMPWSDIVIFDEVYDDVPNVAVGCQRIRAISNSTTRQVADDYWEEVFGSFDIAASECDCRSFGTKTPDSGKTIGQLYNENGILCYPASGQPIKGKAGSEGGLTSLAKEMFALRKDRRHIDVTLGRRNENELDKMGCSVVYITENCYNLVAEMRKYAGEDKDDHLISCLFFFAGRDRPYLGDGYMDNRDKPYEQYEQGEAPARSAITGY